MTTNWPAALVELEAEVSGEAERSSCDVCGATDRPTATVMACGIETNACDKCRSVEESE